MNFEILFNSVFTALCFVFPVYIFRLGISTYRNNEKYKEKMMNKIIKEGHMVSAVIKKSSSLKRDVPGTNNQLARLVTYVYEWKGRKYKYREWVGFGVTPQSSIRLYFFKNPRKAKTEDELYFNSKFPWVAVVVLTVIFYILLK